jgi:hypothetical protein
MHKADTLEKIELPRETENERFLKSIVGIIQTALFRARHGEAYDEQLLNAWNKIGDFRAKQALAKVRV